MNTSFEEINSKLVIAGELRAYKIALVRWRRTSKKVTGGIYISIEKHDGRPDSLDKERAAWFKSQTLTINDPAILDELIKELANYVKLLRDEQAKEKFVSNEDIKKQIEEEDDDNIIDIPHFE